MNSNGHSPDHPRHPDSRPLICRGIRGAVSVEANTPEAILARTAELLKAIVSANNVRAEDVVSAFFTATPDLTAEYPAVAARRDLGWHDVALMCGQEMAVPGSLRMCIRVLIHWNTALRNDEIQHIYLRDAAVLRPDRLEKQNMQRLADSTFTQPRG